MTNPIRIAIAGVAALVVAAVAWSVGAEPAEDAEHRQRIAMKSEAERELLRRRYEAFQRMSPEEQRSIRALHEATTQDRALARSLDDYAKLVSRLQPWDQQELRGIEQPSRRIQKIRTLIAERNPPDGPGRPSWLAGHRSERSTLSPQKFDEAMNRVAEVLHLSEKDRVRIDALDPPERHLEIAKLADERLHKQSRWPEKAEFESIVSLLPDDGFRAMLLREQTPAEFSRRMLAYVLMKSLFAEWQGEIRHNVPYDAIREVLDSLDEKEQAELSSGDPDRLTYKVMEVLAKTSDDRVGKFAKHFVEVAQLLSQFDFRSRGFGWSRSEDRGDRGRPGPPRGRGPGDDRGPPVPPDGRFRGGDDRDGRFGPERRGPGPFGGLEGGGPSPDDVRNRDRN